ncbi:MAG: type II toxin-antitoxin system VapC family toxin [Deltaproteobacteria bacterium]|jgi:PIN domain nuclease of toxin-antitoxin system|uniref:type II toxin-antitoxin system VapC family toxin n=1 Tax=Hydrosulfovibrio ferrireducens TaxID=2934181 RepID=UPI001206E8B2|nr:MAG: type II toxin-antitoxin system VapC family toxin [Deltaproteobacteria bacterium]
MRLLLDTHVLLWVMTNDAALTSTAKETISKATVVYASAVSIWEVSIKAALGKLKIDQDRFMKALPATGFEPLPVTWEHADTVRRLPDIHRDPFDRMLIAQAVSEPLNLMTADKVLIQYSELVLFV